MWLTISDFQTWYSSWVRSYLRRNPLQSHGDCTIPTYKGIPYANFAKWWADREKTTSRVCALLNFVIAKQPYVLSSILSKFHSQQTAQSSVSNVKDESSRTSAQPTPENESSKMAPDQRPKFVRAITQFLAELSTFSADEVLNNNNKVHLG